MNEIHPPLISSFAGASRILAALLTGLFLSTVCVSAQTNVFITELMASNTRTLLDDDGDFEDWIEIYNAGPDAVDLNGWSLKDSGSTWLFPQTNMPPGTFLVVFASNKDRRIPGRTLHTNFKLEKNGEYLALLYPDGVTVASAYANYPIQGSDISYGVTVVQTPITLVSNGAPGKLLIPANDILATLWTQPTFNDSVWTAVTNGIGFESDPAVPLAPVTLADSVAEFSGTQGANNWFYGYWDKTSDINSIYDQSSDFVAFPRGTGNTLSGTNFWDGTKWDWAAGNPPWSEITSTGGHPSGNNGNPLLTNYWTIRRWVCPSNGPIRITGTLACYSQGATCGDGTVAHIFVDGAEVFQRTVFGTSVGYSIIANANPGSLVDFVIDAGMANNDGCDTTTFTAVIRSTGGASIAADSIADWSVSGTQGEKNWSYGNYDRTIGGATYAANKFTPFPSGTGPHSSANYWNGEEWKWFEGDPPYDTIAQIETRPSIFTTGGADANEHWAIRRWVSEVSGTLQVDWHVAKKDLTGGGVTASVYQNGVQRDTVTVAFNDFVGTTRTVTLTGVQVGDPIDFVIAPGADIIGDFCFLNATIHGTGSLASQFASDVGNQMTNVNSTAYLRLRFNVADLATINGLTLRIKYDDGFVAYLNGNLAASANAPATPMWNSTATTSRPDTDAIQFEDFDLSQVKDFLVAGANVLAIHGLNASPTDSDFLITAELVASAASLDTTAKRYFALPTPGSLNGLGTTNLGPLITDAQHTPAEPLDAQDLLITATVSPTLYAVTNVSLYYRISYGAEVPVPMLDDGMHGDGLPGDGLYGASIPNAAYTNGQMIRYYVTSRDNHNNLTRQPPLGDTNNSSLYLGTVCRDPSLTNGMDVIHWFTQNTINTTTFQRASLYWLGEFYDNIKMNVHGQSSQGFRNHSFNVDFNPDHHFKWKQGGNRVDDLNLLSTYADKAHMRLLLSYKIYADSGPRAPYHFCIPARMQSNGVFHSIMHITENGDDRYLARLGRDPNGAMYKMYTDPSLPANAEKKTRRWEDKSDFTNFVAGINSATNRVFLYDNIDVSEVANFFAAMIVTASVDCCHKNFYLYRDSDGDQEWEMLPWDLDLSFGRNWQSTETYWDDRVYPNNGLFVGTTFPLGPQSFFSSAAEKASFRAMYLRRVRTLQDELLQTNGTPGVQLNFERQIDYWTGLMAPDGALDLAKWGTWGQGNGGDGGSSGTRIDNTSVICRNTAPVQPSVPCWRTLPDAAAEMKTNYLFNRRAFVFNVKMNNATEFPDAQPTNVNLVLGTVDYNPASGNQAEEYFQLINTNAFAVDISGWKLSGAIDHTFQAGVVIPRAGMSNILYVVANKKAFRARATAPKAGMGLYIEGPYDGQLSARGESIILTDKNGRSRTNTYTGNPSLAQLYLRITEIMYHPPRDPGGAIDSEEVYEYLELKNISTNVTLNLNGLHFTSGIEFSFTGSAVTNLAPGERVLIVKNAAAFTSRYGLGFNIAGQYVGSLDNTGESLRLEEAIGEKVLDFRFNNSWYRITDGAGASLVVVDATAPWDSFGLKTSWRPSANEKGSPGAGDSAPAQVDPVLITEILTHTDPPLSDAIELHNTNSFEVNIGGWFLTDNLNLPKQYRIPNGTSIGANTYKAFYASNSFGGSFNLSSHGEEVFLLSGGPNTNLTGYIFGFDFGPQANGVTFGRYITSDGKEQFPAQTAPSLGTANVGPKVGPIVISAINYHPTDIATVDGPANNEMDEFVELQNITGVPQPLFDPNFPTNTWRVRGGIDYRFPTNVTIPASGRVLVVPFDPADPIATSRFVLANQSADGAALFGPFDGHLDNSGDNLELARPDVPEPANSSDPNAVFYILVDKVEYSDTAPWPPVGPGVFLHRLNGNGYGNDPANWVVPAAISVHPQSQNVRLPDGPNAVASVTLSVAVSGGPVTYQWRFNGADIPGANGAVLNLSNASFSQGGDYIVVVGNAFNSLTSRVARVNFYTDFVWRFASITGNIGSSSNALGTNLILFMQTAGEAYVDDISLVPLSGPYAGINVITNGDFEAPLTGPWVIPAGMSGSVITNTYAHSGSSSLHVVATSAGSIANSIKQALPLFSTNIFCTLSFWFHSLPNSANLTARTLGGSFLVLTTNILATDMPPGIVSQPKNLAVPPGAAASFSVTTFGSEPFTYEWLKNGLHLADGGKIGGAATATLTVNNAQDSELGDYSVKVSNVLGFTNSTTATLTLVAAPPTITLQPQSQLAPCRGSVTFTVAVSGSAPFTYQWLYNQTPIPNATNASVTLTNLAPTASGLYSVMVTNSLGFTNSSDASLLIEDQGLARLSSRVEGTNLVVSWPRPCTTVYHLEESVTLEPGSWGPSPAPVQETETVSSATIPIADAKRFYRLRN